MQEYDITAFVKIQDGFYSEGMAMDASSKTAAHKEHKEDDDLCHGCIENRFFIIVGGRNAAVIVQVVDLYFDEVRPETAK